MDDDFNTGGAISELFELLRLLNKFADQQQLEDPAARTPAAVASFRRGVETLRELTAVLGLFRTAPPTKSGADLELLNKLMGLLVELRADARKRKDFATADRIRLVLGELGITLEDRKDGTAWRLP
jgi:cysteinyl-tRNA synthetase